MHHEAEKKDLLKEAELITSTVLKYDGVEDKLKSDDNPQKFYGDPMLYKVNISEFIYPKKKGQEIRSSWIIFYNNFIILFLWSYHLTEKQGAG